MHLGLPRCARGRDLEASCPLAAMRYIEPWTILGVLDRGEGIVQLVTAWAW